LNKQPAAVDGGVRKIAPAVRSSRQSGKSCRETLTTAPEASSPGSPTRLLQSSLIGSGVPLAIALFGISVPLPDEDAIINVLDDGWATVTQIRTRLGPFIKSSDLASALGQMAMAGKIEKKLEETLAPKRNNKPMQLSFYRRRVTE
jgi:hypothetical protein